MRIYDPESPRTPAEQDYDDAYAEWADEAVEDETPRTSGLGDLSSAVALLDDYCRSTELAVEDRAEIEDAARAAHKTLGAVLDHNLHALGAQMTERRQQIAGHTWERRRDARYRAWQSDELVRAVLDTRLVDPETGEIVDETPIDKLLAVWRLGAPRLGALRARGLEPDEWAEREERGYVARRL